MVSRSPGWLRTCYVDEDGLLPLPPKCWDERLVLACPGHSGLWIELRASCMLGVHFASSSVVRQLFLCLLLGMFSNLISYDIFPFLVAPHLTLKPFKLKIHVKKPSNSQIFHGIFYFLLLCDEGTPFFELMLLWKLPPPRPQHVPVLIVLSM